MPPKRRAATKPIVEEEEVLPKRRERKARPEEVEEKKKIVEEEEVLPKKRERKARPEEVEEKKKIVEEEEVLPKKRERKARSEEVEEKKKIVEEEEVLPKKRERKARPEEVEEKKKGTSSKLETKKTKEETTKAKKKEPTKVKEKESTKVKEKESAKAEASKAKEKTSKAERTAEPKPALLNTTETNWEEIDFDCKRKNPKGQEYNVKITSWNVDGLRAWLKKAGLNIFKYDSPDILCFQETKCSDEKLPDEVKGIEGYHEYWCSSDKEGYAGVAVYSKKEPFDVKVGIGEEDHDKEGRCLTLEYTDFFLVNVYVPNAGRGLVTLDKRLDWNEAFKNYIKELDKKKPVIICGDMNVAHNEIDLANPKTNKRNAGFTQEERDGMTDFLADGYVDSFRELYPEQPDVYTFWSYMTKARSKNVGWRLDYFIVSKRIMGNVCDNIVRNEVYGSDHCPITLFINF